ncbi:MAG: hypothetical protein ABSE04_01515 [Candidatus Microgenomates bacterium]|jgi:hypothetical protein
MNCTPINGVGTIGNLGCLVQRTISLVLGLAGIVLFVILIVGGFKYITSGGDPKAVETAKKTLTYAVAGLIIILVSYLILVLISNITGVNVTQFNVVVSPGP